MVSWTLNSFGREILGNLSAAMAFSSSRFLLSAISNSKSINYPSNTTNLINEIKL